MNVEERRNANRKRNARRNEDAKFWKGWKAWNKATLAVQLIWDRMTRNQRRATKVRLGLRPAANMYGGHAYVRTDKVTKPVNRSNRRTLATVIAAAMAGRKKEQDGKAA